MTISIEELGLCHAAPRCEWEDALSVRAELLRAGFHVERLITSVAANLLDRSDAEVQLDVDMYEKTGNRQTDWSELDESLIPFLNPNLNYSVDLCYEYVDALQRTYPQGMYKVSMSEQRGRFNLTADIDVEVPPLLEIEGHKGAQPTYALLDLGPYNPQVFKAKLACAHALASRHLGISPSRLSVLNLPSGTAHSPQYFDQMYLFSLAQLAREVIAFKCFLGRKAS